MIVVDEGADDRLKEREPAPDQQSSQVGESSDAVRSHRTRAAYASRRSASSPGRLRVT
jgi:hypothetical protein